MFTGTTKKIEFQQTIYGTWGRFQTPAGTVEFLETKARIGTASKDREKRLTGFLRPVREVLPTQSMDFNQLLQRDLDDHRVATGLVPYVLNASKPGPAFFPPIVAALLPFDGNRPLRNFPTMLDIEHHIEENMPWRGYRFGTSFKFERLQSPTEKEDNEIKLGRLSWNPEEAKMVVIDGQHRAMALLAIDRTLNNTWSESGEKYKYFYEPIVQELLRGKDEAERKELFDNLEFPVTVVWFPNVNREGGDHHSSARKLFVDVNQNARTPSESRILLLSDGDLLSIFTRRVLNEFRNEQPRAFALPIFAVEYDHPGRDQAATSKWSAISNVIIIRDCVNRAVFGPDKYIIKMALSFSGRESESERSDCMRRTLQIFEDIGEVVEDLKRDEIGNERFPNSKLDFLQQQFMRGWGNFVVRFLSELLPYRIHGEALSQLRDGWATAGSTDSLAKDALFEGVGMYWTIRDSQKHWEDSNRLRGDLKQDSLPKTDIVRTWEVMNSKKEEFCKLRSKIFLGKEDSNTLDLSNGSFDVFATNACQLGFVLAARSLAHRADIKLDKMEDFTNGVIQSANRAFEGGPKGENGRRTIFWKGHTDALNRITKLDTPFAVYFRYFWLEMLASQEGSQVIQSVLPLELVFELRDRSRYSYFQYLVKDIVKLLKRTNPTMSTKDADKKAEEAASELLRKALYKWFGILKADFEVWKDAQKSAPPEVLPSDNGDNSDSTDGTSTLSSSQDQAEASAVPSFEDLLSARLEDY